MSNLSYCYSDTEIVASIICMNCESLIKQMIIVSRKKNMAAVKRE